MIKARQHGSRDLSGDERLVLSPDNDHYNEQLQVIWRAYYNKPTSQSHWCIVRGISQFVCITTDSYNSDLRQIPDAQEVFLDRNSDMSFIFEVLDRVEPTDPKDAARYIVLWSFCR